jgi:signal transduction histidine kinase
MKLLGERHLGGRVAFESDPRTGTRFWITLPLVS